MTGRSREVRRRGGPLGYPAPDRFMMQLWIALIPAVLVACNTETDASAPIERAVHTIGGDRPASLTLPAGYDGRMPLPLVMVLHGFTGNAEWTDNRFGISGRIDADNIAVALPNGTRNPEDQSFWNATDYCCNFHGSDVDDVGYLNRLAEDAGEHMTVGGVYLVGLSNGGFMSYRMVCESMPGLRAIASVAGTTFADPERCDDAGGSVSILHIHGTADNTIRYEGGQRRGGARYPGAVETVRRWAVRGGCDPAAGELAAPMDLLAGLPGAETDVMRYRTGCSDAHTIELWTIQDGPHVPDFDPNDFGARVVAWLTGNRASGSPAADPFAATPADGPAPEIGPAPADYRPTAAGAPSTDIWLGHLERGADGTLAVRDPVNVTARDGYDNQPAFDAAGGALYFTSAVDSTQTEIVRFSIGSGAAQQVTRTPGASEFSPTAIPGQDALSAIHEERGVQYLWRYGTDGSDLGPIFATVEPVGYHAWADERTAVMFVLGDPPTLQVGNALTGEVRTVAANPGRSIHRIPGTAAVSFVRKASEDEWWIERLDPDTGETERITRTLPGREDYAWTPAGEILMGDGASLRVWTQGAAGWTEVAAPGLEDAGEVSRLAVSPDGSRIAMVRAR